jgi:SM-20-related protein
MQIVSDSWSRLRLQRQPYRWLATAPGEFCSLKEAGRLADTFPAEGFVRRNESERASGKRYSNFSRPLNWPEDEGALGAEWRRLVADLLSPDYRDHVARILGQERAAELELRLVYHSSGDWLGPHTDRDDKLFSHVIYFNRGWSAAWGGCLQILRHNDPASVVATISPELGASVLLARASNSWHQVTEVSPGAPAQRRSLLIHGLRR